MEALEILVSQGSWLEATLTKVGRTLKDILQSDRKVAQKNPQTSFREGHPTLMHSNALCHETRAEESMAFSRLSVTIRDSESFCPSIKVLNAPLTMIYV